MLSNDVDYVRIYDLMQDREQEIVQKIPNRLDEELKQFFVNLLWHAYVGGHITATDIPSSLNINQADLYALKQEPDEFIFEFMKERESYDEYIG